MGVEISVTEFKAKCLELFDKLSRREIDAISVTKRGKTVAVVSPCETEKEQRLSEIKSWQARMKGGYRVIDPAWDPTAATSDLSDFDAFDGKVIP
jgi:antitoxin (DNA-binding transcriptional repressor) of toxin-antitoxin stability system